MVFSEGWSFRLGFCNVFSWLNESDSSKGWHDDNIWNPIQDEYGGLHYCGWCVAWCVYAGIRWRCYGYEIQTNDSIPSSTNTPYNISLGENRIPDFVIAPQEIDGQYNTNCRYSSLTPQQIAIALDGIRIRTKPRTDANRISSIAEDTPFIVIDGPICNQGYEWWLVDYYGTIGWAASGNSGFGLLWNNNQAIREHIGWAFGTEASYSTSYSYRYNSAATVLTNPSNEQRMRPKPHSGASSICPNWSRW
jgi:hypothetical protein